MWSWWCSPCGSGGYHGSQATGFTTEPLTFRPGEIWEHRLDQPSKMHELGLFKSEPRSQLVRGKRLAGAPCPRQTPRQELLHLLGAQTPCAQGQGSMMLPRKEGILGFGKPPFL